MMMGFSPSFKAMLRLEEEAGARKLAGMKAEGAKPWTETAARAVMDKKSFMIASYLRFIVSLFVGANNRSRGCEDDVFKISEKEHVRDLLL
jgi:hypothetical protein